MKKYYISFKLVLTCILLLSLITPTIAGLKEKQPPHPPVANFHWTPEFPDPGEIITLNASESYAEHHEHIVAYYWDLNEDGCCDDATGMITECCHYSCNLYYVTLTVEDNLGQTGKRTKAIDLRDPPEKPTIAGKQTGKLGEEYTLSVSTNDPNNDKVYYKIDWGPKDTDWLGPYPSGNTIEFSNSWENQGDYKIKVKAMDTTEAESDWAEFEITIPMNKYTTLQSFVYRFFEHSFIFEFLKLLFP